ncbi:MAG: PIN domain-containing protein [Candidatus Binataceae bacterium]
MNVLVDTSVWSRVLRRAQPHIDSWTRELAELIREGRAVMIGPIRQELLSGVGNTEQLNLLRNNLRAFPDLLIATPDYEEAASFFNRCRARGIQGSNVDFLICAVACRRELAIFTTDNDFAAFAKVLPITLHRTR